MKYNKKNPKGVEVVILSSFLEFLLSDCENLDNIKSEYNSIEGEMDKLQFISSIAVTYLSVNMEDFDEIRILDDAFNLEMEVEMNSIDSMDLSNLKPKGDC